LIQQSTAASVFPCNLLLDGLSNDSLSEMFSSLISSKRSVGVRNIDSVREKLKELAIPIIAEDVGGKVGRSVKFFLENGETEIRKRI